MPVEILKNCIYCGKEFTISNIFARKSILCSDSCKGEYNKKINYSKRNDDSSSYIKYLKSSGYNPRSIDSFIKRFKYEINMEENLYKQDNPYLYSSKDDNYGKIGSFK